MKTESQAEQLRALIAASGSGGHLVPALLIANALREQAPGARIEFVGSGRPLEPVIIDAAGYRRHVVHLAGINRRGLRGLAQLLRLPAAFAEVRRIFSELRPHVVVGVGGYASFVPVTVAFLSRRPSWIHEAEYHPGMANFVLSLYASRISTAFPEARLPRWARPVYTGQPVRPEVAAVGMETQAGEIPRRVLIVGGSQGARSLDEAMPRLSGVLRARQLEVYHQCRPESVEHLRRTYQAEQVPARVVGFIDDMADAYRWSDLIVSRAGASAVIEIGAVNRPALLVPYPHSQGGHQTVNARFLERAGKAMIVEEGPQFEQRLQAAFEKLLTPATYQAMRVAPPEQRSLQAAASIALGIVELANRRRL